MNTKKECSMGNLLKEIEETVPKNGGCLRKLDLILEKLGEDDRNDLLQALNDHTISPTIIARVLRKRGFDLTRSTVQRYRGAWNGD